jgi:hypothetical protein
MLASFSIWAAMQKHVRNFKVASRLGSLMMIGEILEDIGDTFSRNDGDYKRASTEYEAATKKYTEVGPMSPIAQKGIERCKQKWK